MRHGCLRYLLPLLFWWYYGGGMWCWTAEYALCGEPDPRWPAAYVNAQKLYKLDAKPLVIDIGASWCGYCPEARRRIEAIEKDLGRKVLFVYLDWDEHDPPSLLFPNKTTLPAVVIFDGVGDKRTNLIGLLSKEQYRQAIQASLDRTEAAK